MGSIPDWGAGTPVSPTPTPGFIHFDQQNLASWGKVAFEYRFSFKN